MKRAAIIALVVAFIAGSAIAGVLFLFLRSRAPRTPDIVIVEIHRASSAQSNEHDLTEVIEQALSSVEGLGAHHQRPRPRE